jgi:LmbE family N-acetylglucosaminyl deacetylase
MNSISSVLGALPIADLDCIAGTGSPMILAPHPDDESLGCGGLIAESCARGRPPVVVIMTDGTASHPSSLTYPPARLREVREKETTAALGALGLSSKRLYFLRLPDGGMPESGAAYDAAITKTKRIYNRHGCKTIFAPWFYDPHCDHQRTQLMARVVAIHFKAVLLSYPVWAWLLPTETIIEEQIKGWRLDISAHLSTKRVAIQNHRSQYADLIADDPEGFILPRELLAVFDQPFEVFLQAT